MTTTEIKEKIEQVQRHIFYEQMADFMDWDAYYKLKDELYRLKEELKKRGE